MVYSQTLLFQQTTSMFASLAFLLILQLKFPVAMDL